MMLRLRKFGQKTYCLHVRRLREHVHGADPLQAVSAAFAEDGKAQVTVEYKDNIPHRIAGVVVSAQHQESISIDNLRQEILSHVIAPALPTRMMDKETQIFINPTGRFVVGGPAADSGLTGRKIIVDTYGGYARHGGGAFSGKDASKVDRSGAYLARYIAKSHSCAAEIHV